MVPSFCNNACMFKNSVVGNIKSSKSDLDYEYSILVVWEGFNSEKLYFGVSFTLIFNSFGTTLNLNRLF